MRFSASCVALVSAMAAASTGAFAPLPASKRSSSTTSSLAVLPPPMIIGPLLKKMRNEKEEQNRPLADRDEVIKEAPGLKVGKGTWKWPSIWPYDKSFFTPIAEAKAKEAQQPAMDKVNDMASMMSGIAQVPKGEVAAEDDDSETDDKEEEVLFDGLKFWQDVEEKTELDEDAAQKLREHYSYYLKDGMSVLELGAAEESYLPEGLKLARHFGVGASEAPMKENPSITETMVLDLNHVVDGRDVDNDNFRLLAKEPFDVVIMANTVDYLTGPREVFRSAWYLLKPGGKMIVSFMSKEGAKEKFVDAKTRMWQDYNDDQHLWITGSFFQFSAGDGWEDLLGFDVSPESAKEADTGNNLFKRLTDFKGKANNYFVVQATKGFQDDKLDVENAERSINSLCWMLPVMEDRDKKLVVPRLSRAVEKASSPSVIKAVEQNIQHLPKIYETLGKMDQYAFTLTMQAQMAADLVTNPDFTASDEELLALKQGLGLRTPSEEFWVPIGQNTANMDIEDRINLLSYVVPCFGSGDKGQEEALEAFASGLKPTFELVRNRCPDLAAGDVELLGTELLAAEVLKPGSSTREEYAAWLSSLTKNDLEAMLKTRKSIRETANKEMKAFQEERAEKERQVEEYKAKMNEQVETARTTRSLVFNPKTQKMEVFDNPNKDKK